MQRLTLLLFLACSLTATAVDPAHDSQLIFPVESWHNHGSCIVECSNGDLLACWFHGSGERRSDDVLILGARKRKGGDTWSEPFLMADAPGFPDTNCCMIIDQRGRLWLLWPTIMANLWESALMKYKISTDYMTDDGPPKWDTMRVMHVKPGEEFEAKVREKTEAYIGGREVNERTQRWVDHNYEQAADKLTRRLGWFTRAHPNRVIRTSRWIPAPRPSPRKGICDWEATSKRATADAVRDTGRRV